MAEAAKAQLAEPPKRPPSSSLAAGIAPTGNEYRDRKARLYLPYISLVFPLHLLYISPPRPQGARGGRARERGAARADAHGRTAHDCAEVKAHRQMRQQGGMLISTDGVHRPDTGTSHTSPPPRECACWPDVGPLSRHARILRLFAALNLVKPPSKYF